MSVRKSNIIYNLAPLIIELGNVFVNRAGAGLHSLRVLGLYLWKVRMAPVSVDMLLFRSSARRDIKIDDALPRGSDSMNPD